MIYNIMPDDEPLRSDGTPHATEEKLRIFQCTNDMTQLRFFESLIGGIAI